jgi:citrate lyase subunit beta/citryl-CoA lyase
MSSFTATPLAAARSFLFVPGNRPERFEKAARSGADAVVLDLEDAVPLSDKASARAAIKDAWPLLRGIGVPLVIRMNAVDHAFGNEDLALLAQLDSIDGVMVPKTESALALDKVHTALPEVPLLPLIESAAGYLALSSIAASAGVQRLVVGHIDFMADTGIRCSDDEAELAPLRFAVAMATSACRLAPAVDGVTVGINDEDQLRRDTQRTLKFGFGGKLCIHPRQIPLVHAVLSPTPEEIAWARRVLEADARSGGAAVQMDGKMVDLPVVLQARRLMARAATS